MDYLITRAILNDYDDPYGEPDEAARSLCNLTLDLAAGAMRVSLIFKGVTPARVAIILAMYDDAEERVIQDIEEYQQWKLQVQRVVGEHAHIGEWVPSGLPTPNCIRYEDAIPF